MCKLRPHGGVFSGFRRRSPPKLAISPPILVIIADLWKGPCRTYRDMARILLLNGPNLNLLGTREPEIYGSDTLQVIETRLTGLAQARGHALVAFQSNAEHELIAKVQATKSDKVAFVIINPAGYSHTSVALRDAFLAVAAPFIEVHLSNVFSREGFRHHSYLSDIAVGCIVGLGPIGYELALDAACAHLANN
jgi:3-dehydroquinate dehydratase II